MKAHYKNIDFQFKFPAGTSRGVLLNKPSSFFILEEDGVVGIGECSIIPALSIDFMGSYQQKLHEVCDVINDRNFSKELHLEKYPSIKFGLEMALQDFQMGGNRLFYKDDFTLGDEGIPINGLIWMGDKEFMLKQITEKLEAGFKCIKLKVGALDFASELEIISGIRQHFSSEEIEIRLDANGGFTPENALEKLQKFSKYSIHSIEQPIKSKQWEKMAELCEKSPIPIVLDEELIGLSPDEEMLQQIKPAYIILKPSLIGGFAVSEHWIGLAKKNNIDWWITSALESNIGLNAIAQWTHSLKTSLPQGLGTGQIYNNNILSPLEIKDAKLYYNNEMEWDLSELLPPTP